MNANDGRRDPDLQAERTALAWSRTALAVRANALLVLRSGWVSERTTITALGFVPLLAAAAIYLHGAWRRRELVAAHRPVAPRAGTTAIIVLAACAIGLASVVVTSIDVGTVGSDDRQPGSVASRE